MKTYRVTVDVEIEATSHEVAYERVCEVLCAGALDDLAGAGVLVRRDIEEVEPEPTIVVTPEGVAYLSALSDVRGLPVPSTAESRAEMDDTFGFLVEEHALTPEDQMRVFDVIMRGPGEDFPVPEFMTDPINSQE
jgi:hypothetical protein